MAMTPFLRSVAAPIAALGVLLVLPVQARALALKSPDSTLDFVPVEGGFALQLSRPNAQFTQPTPLALELIGRDGTARHLTGVYTRITPQGKGALCDGEILTPAGSRLHFTDRYTPQSDGFEMQRNVTVPAADPRDSGFATRFSLAWGTPTTTRDCDVLMPGAWYRDNTNVPPKAFAANIDFQSLLYREDQLGLPLVAARNKQSGVALELEHVGGRLTTFAGEGGRERAVDERFQIGTLGVLNAGRLEAAFTYPGTQDERATLDGEAGARFAPRFHPVKTGVSHSYTLHFEVTQPASYAALVEQAAKGAFERSDAPLLRADLYLVRRASIGLLNTVIQDYNGTTAVPFQLTLPDGEVKDTSTQMGFVGMALPCAALLLKDGLENGTEGATMRASKVLDFWVQQSPEASGVPKTWADFPEQDQVAWRGYPTYLRVASDGMRGVLDAWSAAQKNGLNKPTWLQYARGYGDFLVGHQNEDGSWFSAWNFDGTPRERTTNASTHPLAFLVDLSKATGDARYQAAALKAGEFCLRTVNDAYSYVGGTPDNPNVTDKEAGVLAAQGFMALYDATGDAKWLAAAKQAALFCETWIYWRNLPMPATPGQVFPRGRSTVGLSLIATGHSGADNFMAGAPFLWYRLSLATGDPHFARVGRLLLHDTKQIMDWDGTLGYKYPGLMPEAMNLSTERGQGVAGWLPWLTYVSLEPMVRLKDTFGFTDIDDIEKLPLAKRRELSDKFGKTHGFPPVKASASVAPVPVPATATSATAPITAGAPEVPVPVAPAEPVTAPAAPQPAP